MIGIFDSGIGGLTVVRSMMKTLPGYDIVYFGDTARTPYGSKSPENIIKYSIQDTKLLLDKGAELIIIACNTASSVATETLKNTFKVPFFEVVTPAVEESVKISKKKQIGIIGTRATIKSGIYEKKILESDSKAKVYSSPCPLLVPLVEEGWLKKPETTMIIKKYLLPLKVRQIDTLVLACTHYPILKKIIHRKIGLKVNIIDSSVAVSNKVKEFLEANPEIESGLSRNNKSHFYVSDITDQFKVTAQSLLKRKVHLEHVQL